MRFRLRTLLTVVTLAAVYAAAVRVEWGPIAYAVCVSAFGMVWRIKVVLGRLAPGALSDSPVAHAVDILLVNAGVAVLAAVLATVAFYITMYTTVLLGMVVLGGMGPKGHVRGGLWEEIAILLVCLAIPFVSSNAAVMGCYWLSWPREENENACTSASAR